MCKIMPKNIIMLNKSKFTKYDAESRFGVLVHGFGGASNWDVFASRGAALLLSWQNGAHLIGGQRIERSDFNDGRFLSAIGRQTLSPLPIVIAALGPVLQDHSWVTAPPQLQSVVGRVEHGQNFNYAIKKIY